MLQVKYGIGEGKGVGGCDSEFNWFCVAHMCDCIYLGCFPMCTFSPNMFEKWVLIC